MKSTDQQTAETKVQTSEVAREGAAQSGARPDHPRSPVRMKIRSNIKAGSTTFTCSSCGSGNSNHNQSTARARRAH